MHCTINKYNNLVNEIFTICIHLQIVNNIINEIKCTLQIEAVHNKSGMGNPFDDMAQPGLERATIASLAAERDSIAHHLTGPIQVQKQA